MYHIKYYVMLSYMHCVCDMLFHICEMGRAVTKVGRTCGPTLLLVHVCMLSNKICLNRFHICGVMLCCIYNVRLHM